MRYVYFLSIVDLQKRIKKFLTFQIHQILQDNRSKKCIEWTSLEILNEIVNKEIQTLEFNLATEEDVCFSNLIN